LHSWRTVFAAGNLHLVVIGFTVSFVVALASVKWFIRFVQVHSLKPFGWYRIIMGILVAWWFSRVISIS
jgi:undecaprenyl-diphosphatase